MIFEFKVENYLSFREEQILSFEPSSSTEYESQYCVDVKEGVKVLKVGLLYGANASGKTNLLKALDFLRKFVLIQKKDKTESTGILKFQFDNDYIEKPSKFHLSFYLNQVKYIYSIILEEKVVVEESLIYYPGTQPAIFFERRFDKSKEKSIIKFGGTLDLKLSDRRLIEGLTISNSSVFSAFAKANVEKSLFDDVFNWFKDSFMQMIQPTTDLFGWTSSRVEEDDLCKDFVLEVLQKADFNISSIDIDDAEIPLDEELEAKISRMNIPDSLKEEILENKVLKAKDISFQHKTKLMEKNLPRKLESNGTIRYYGLGGVLNKLLSSNTFLCIDEIENSLHYDLVAHFIKTFLMNSVNSQLLFSTHDINLLNEDFLRRDTVWFVDKNEFGASELDSLLDFKLHKNLSPYNAYKIGKLGAKPELGEIILKNMARKGKNKPTKFKVAIIGEGETEWYYFTNMRQYEKFGFKVEPDLPKHSDYQSIINTARRKRDEGYDIVFCVLDLDRIITNPTEKKGYTTEKLKKKANKGIEFVETMPCIELWFLLHFIDKFSSKIYLDYNQVSKPLKSYIPNYEKTANFFKANPIYEFLINNGDFNKADIYAQKLLIQKQNSTNPLFNFSEINELICKLKKI